MSTSIISPITGMATEDNHHLRGVLFDLDGTLADTAPDMAGALDALCEEQGIDPLPYAQVRPVVSHGSRGLVQLVFGDYLEGAQLAALCERFLEHYAETFTARTRLFSGMDRVLQSLEEADLAWGVVTNKPGWLTEPLLDALSVRERAACVVSGDSLDRRKPHPLPLQHAARNMGLSPAQCLYLGDAQRDIEAGLAAGMRTLVALYGYISASEQPQEWGAHGLIREPGELLSWVTQK